MIGPFRARADTAALPPSIQRYGTLRVRRILCASRGQRGRERRLVSAENALFGRSDSGKTSCRDPRPKINRLFQEICDLRVEKPVEKAYHRDDAGPDGCEGSIEGTVECGESHPRFPTRVFGLRASHRFRAGGGIGIGGGRQCAYSPGADRSPACAGMLKRLARPVPIVYK